MGAVAEPTKPQRGTASASAKPAAPKGSPDAAPTIEEQRRKHAGKVDLVLAGGGVKGIAHAGALKALQDLGYTSHPRVAGTSVGAIVGTLVAHDVSPCKIWQIMLDQEFSTMADRRRWLGDGRLGDAAARVPLHLIPGAGLVASAAGLRQHVGAHPGQTATDWLATEFKKAGVTTFGTLREHKQAELLEAGEWHPGDDPIPPPLVILATDVTLGRLVQFPRDFALYGLTPEDQPILTAVRASMSVPLYFDPYRFDASTTVPDDWDGPRIEDSQFVDGGVLANFAVDALDRQETTGPRKARRPLPSRWPTFGITLLKDHHAGDLGKGLREATFDPKFADNLLLGNALLGFADALIGTLVGGQDQQVSEHLWMKFRTIQIDTSGYEIVEFDITDADKLVLYRAGYDATKIFYEHTWKGSATSQHGFDGRAKFPLPPVDAKPQPCKGTA